MIWQDISILAAQGVMLVALIPTLRDRSKWPHRATAAITAGALVRHGRDAVLAGSLDVDRDRRSAHRRMG